MYILLVEDRTLTQECAPPPKKKLTEAVTGVMHCNNTQTVGLYTVYSPEHYTVAGSKRDI